MLCKLCHKEATLRKSHIIPEFFYKPTYDALHRFEIITTNPDVKERYSQKGIREEMLCDNCEQLFARWEHYAKETFVDGNGLTAVNVKEGVVLKGIDYSKFKLFLLSILWRMGVSSLDIFKDVRLGTYHEKVLRTALLNSDPPVEDRYVCFLTALTLNGEARTEWIIPPTFVMFRNQHCYRVLINGILYCFLVSKRPAPKKLKPLFLNRHNQILVLTGDVVDVPFLFEAVSQFSKAIKARASK
jgi:hypothetical protein